MADFHLRPSEIRYTQNSRSNTFGNYGGYANRLIGESLDDILLGNCNVHDIPTIRVVRRNDAWYSADNRRLWVLKKAEEFGKCAEIPVYITYDLPDSKFTTHSSGMNIKIRRDPGGSIWRWQTPRATIRERSGTALFTNNQNFATRYSGNNQYLLEFFNSNALTNKRYAVFDEDDLSGYEKDSDRDGYGSKNDIGILPPNITESGRHPGSVVMIMFFIVAALSLSVFVYLFALS
ncbi:hypothetical protein KUTeg_004378 [Tegillarca granosa]|uniref:Uncharacterized protein n=1 Tax=Tegillarca granosa TaxID=220873 RepID=A0ABQ9FTH1_TEGGR|nr:hypothetical protein KUTeg_004378 [Tegillarca granosa]